MKFLNYTKLIDIVLKINKKILIKLLTFKNKCSIILIKGFRSIIKPKKEEIFEKMTKYGGKKVTVIENEAHFV